MGAFFSMWMDFFFLGGGEGIVSFWESFSPFGGGGGVGSFFLFMWRMFQFWSPLTKISADAHALAAKVVANISHWGKLREIVRHYM